jgi:hypothetical protein
MAKRATPPTASDDQVQALLKRYHCPVPFHAVRTRFLGNIASPEIQGSPIIMVEALWGAELPTFDSIDDANELIVALVMGLWNRLTRHQERSAPFRLTHMEVPATRKRNGLTRPVATRGAGRIRRRPLRRQGTPRPAGTGAQGAWALAEIRAMLEGTQVLAEDPTKPVAPDDIAVTIGHFRELTRIAEHEIHEAVLSCTRARRQMLASLPTRRPVLH